MKTVCVLVDEMVVVGSIEFTEPATLSEVAAAGVAYAVEYRVSVLVICNTVVTMVVEDPEPRV